MTRTLTVLSSLCSLRNMCGELGSPRWRQVAHHFALTLVGVLTGTDSHALCAPSCGCAFCKLLGPDGTSLDVLRKQLSIASSLAPPHPLPTPSQPSGLSLSLSCAPLSLRRGTTLGHLVSMFYTSVWATHSPRRSPSHKPSLAIEHTIARIYQDVRKNELTLHACTSTVFVPFHVFVSFLK